MESVLEYIGDYSYFAMFAILLLCGVGLPLPEEVTLIASGLYVGWHDEASFVWATVACVSAIILGDSIPFLLGKKYGERFLRRILSAKRYETASAAFTNHSVKTVFFARFVAGLRIPLYAYAGSNGMRYSLFVVLDLAGALISGPTSIWIGKYAAEKLGSPEEAQAKAQEWAGQAHFWILLVVGIAALATILIAVHHWLKRKMLENGDSKKDAAK